MSGGTGSIAKLGLRVGSDSFRGRLEDPVDAAIRARRLGHGRKERIFGRVNPVRSFASLVKQRVMDPARGVDAENISPNLTTMISCRKSEWSARQLDVDLGLDPSESMAHSWSGIDLFVDLQIDASQTDVDSPDTTVSRDSLLEPSDLMDSHHEPGNGKKSGVSQLDPGVSMEPLLVIQETTEVLKDLLVVNEQNGNHTDSHHESGNGEKSGVSQLDPEVSKEPLLANQQTTEVIKVLPVSQQQDDEEWDNRSSRQDFHHELGNGEKAGVSQLDTEVSKEPLLVNQEAIKDSLLANQQKDDQECDKQSIRQEKCGTGADLDANSTGIGCPFAWPDWGEPLSPELPNIDGHNDVDDDVVEKNLVPRKVTFSDVVTVLQEERETGSFSYLLSSDDELEPGSDQVTSSSDRSLDDVQSSPHSSPAKGLFNSADVTAACQLLELSNIPDCGDSGEKDLQVSGASQGRGRSDYYDPTYDLERLSVLVESIYATLPQLSTLTGIHGRDSSAGAGTWSIEVSKDSGKFRLKRIKRAGYREFRSWRPEDYDSEVLERPPSKRQYKSLRTLL